MVKYQNVFGKHILLFPPLITSPDLLRQSAYFAETRSLENSVMIFWCSFEPNLRQCTQTDF